MNMAEVQEAIVDRLGAVAAVTGLLGSAPSYQANAIYTNVSQPDAPESTGAFPYIVVSGVTATPQDDKDQNAVEALVDVHAFHRTNSQKALNELSDAVYDALHLHALSVTGANLIECRFNNAVDFEDPDDGRTWHSVRTFKVLYYLGSVSV